MASHDLDVDTIIAKLLEVRGSRPGRQVQLAEHEIRGLCLRAREIFMSQPILLELEAPIKICGKFFCYFLAKILSSFFCTQTLRTNQRRAFLPPSSVALYLFAVWLISHNL